MAIDAYSHCPGGTGKKIKFCCNDFLPELQKIDRMVEGEQYLASLQHIDRLLAQEPGRDRACLLATKCSLLRATQQDEAARSTAAAFLAKHPDNQLALAESAMVAAADQPLAALDLVRRALRASAGNLAGRTYQAMGVVAATLLRDGFPLPARALLQLQAEIAADNDHRPTELLAALSQAADIPLLLREEPPLLPCPEGAPWQEKFNGALEAVAMADWQLGIEHFTALAAEVPDAPAVWRNLATLRSWLADNAGCIDALRRYAAIRSTAADGLEDAVEAEATALLLSDDPLGDRIEMLRVVWTVKDAERAQETFLSSPRMHPVPFDPAQFSDGETPPPKAAYMLLDRAMLDSAEGFTIENAPRLLGQALLFGRQTDREARFEAMDVAADELSAITQLINGAAGDAVDPQPQTEVMNRWSASQKLLRAAWQPPRGVSPDQLRAMLDQHHRDGVLERWPTLKLGVLDGRTPQEASQDADYRLRLLAAILVLESWSERLAEGVDFNELRSRLGLPVLGPIDPREHTPSDLPVGRLARLEVEGLSDRDVMVAYYRAGAFNVRAAAQKFAEEIVRRPSLADSDERMHAYATLARSEEDIEKALAYVAQGRRAAEAKKESSASWDLMELGICFSRRDGRNAMRLIQHIQGEHLEEPGVGEMLTRMLVGVGLLRPDGTPAFDPAAPPAMPSAQEPGEPSGLWTPDSAQPAAGGGKLWTPE